MVDGTTDSTITTGDREYRDWRVERLRTFVTWSLCGAAGAFSIFGITDFWLHPWELVKVTTTTQLLIVVPLLLFFAHKISHCRAEQFEPTLLLAGLTAIGPLVGLLTYAQATGYPLPYEGLLLITLFVFLLSGISVRAGVLLVSFMICGYIAGSVLITGMTDKLISEFLFMLITAAIGCLGSINQEMSNRRIYAFTNELNVQTRTDPLTGLGNRRALEARYSQIWQLAAREKETLGLLYIDIDFFKRLNDHSGHAAGDDALVTVAKLLQSSLKRPLDIAGRVGGEEFLVIVYGLTPGGIKALCEKIHLNLQQAAIAHPDSPLSTSLTVSIGAVSHKPLLHTPNIGLWDEADKALYAAKQRGRNRTVFASSMDSGSDDFYARALDELRSAEDVVAPDVRDTG